MKKLYVVLAVFLSLGIMNVVAADLRSTPYSGMTTSIPADYGGVDVATNSFYVGHTTVPTENGPRGFGYAKFSTTNVNGVIPQLSWLIHGVNFSTGLCGNSNYVSVVVSTSGITQSRELTRIYNNVSISTSGGTPGISICGGPVHLKWPVRAYGNLFYGVNIPGPGDITGTGANPLNRADLLYYLRQD